MTLSMNGKANRLALGFALVLAAATFAVPRAAAQQLEGVGVRAGYVRADLEDEFGGTDPLNRFMAGVFAPVRFSEALAVVPEVMYAQKGARLDLTDYRLDYLDVQVLGKLRVPLTGYFETYVAAGPYVAFVLNRSTDTDLEGEPEISAADFDDSDYGVTGEVGIEVPLGESALLLSVRHDFGLPTVLEVPVGQQQVMTQFHTRTLFITAGFHF